MATDYGNVRDWRQITRELAVETDRVRIFQLLQELGDAMERAPLGEKSPWSRGQGERFQALEFNLEEE